MIGIIDYGVGNLFSLRSSFEAIGEQVIVSGEKEILEKMEIYYIKNVKLIINFKKL